MNKAFSLVELVISAALIILFAGLTIPRYVEYSEQLKLKKEAGKLASVLELAKKKAIAAELFDPDCTAFGGYRVVVTANSFDLVFVCGAVTSEVQSFSVETNISITAGTGNYVFRPMGANLAIPSTTIRFRHAGLDECLNITVEDSGTASIDGSPYGC